MFETTGYFGSVESVVSVLPFYFNNDNSDIAVEPFIDGMIEISVTFGTGKGWKTLAESIEECSVLSDQWGQYTLGYC